ncbi:hypothetical protein, partial [Lysinibacillus boronitolerans]|uniref:hypothetical protein n=1 Tax=Lysinibacillus boronitolerans TaxID=309788 RepID=UPI000474FE8D
MNREDLKDLGMFECIQFLRFISISNDFDMHLDALEAAKESNDINLVLEALERLFEQYELLSVVMKDVPDRMFDIETNSNKKVLDEQPNKNKQQLKRKLPNYF